jgi:sugar fermentation stimulation protein A
MFLDTVQGEFIQRLNRFAALVKVGEKAVRCYMPNPGRMKELLIPGVRMLLRPAKGEGRRTPYDIVAVELDGKLVSIDSRLPNKIIAEALGRGALPEFQEYDEVIPESRYHNSRFDFLLRGGGPECFMEVKSCTLVIDGVALFPDAPTVRGARHVRHLTEAKREGYRACIIFVIQRDDALTFSPNTETDPAFSEALKEAQGMGVEIFAYTCQVSMDGVVLDRSIPVRIP